MTKDMTKGSPLRLILTFSIPMLLGNLFQQFYNMVDSIIVGKYISTRSGWVKSMVSTVKRTVKPTQSHAPFAT